MKSLADIDEMSDGRDWRRFLQEVSAPGAGRSSPDACACNPVFDDSFLLITEVRTSPAPGAD
jgi:hypothetical protein